jgi:CheY-like chemotaxis protein
LFSLPRLR